MTHESRRPAGVLLVLFPTVILGGASLLTLLIRDPAYRLAGPSNPVLTCRSLPRDRGL